MKTRRTIAAAALAAVIVALLLAPISQPAARAEAGKKDAPVTKLMEKINDNYKILVKQAKKLAFDEESIKLVVEIEDLTLKALHEAPPMADKADKVPADKKAAFLIDYKKAMAEMLQHTIELEIALQSGDKEGAKAIVEKLTAGKKAGHDKFVEE